MSIVPPLSRTAPRLTLPYSGIRRVLAWPARLLDGLEGTVELPLVDVAERARRLDAGASSAEGGLALQPDLATVGDAETWTSCVVRGRTALAVGGVHGPDRGAAFARFRAETAARGVRRQAVYPVREPDLGAARSAGFVMRPVGIEAWVDLPGFDLRGKRFADLRQMRNRAARTGVTIEEAHGDAWQGRIVETWQAFLVGRQVPWQVRWLSGGLPAAGSRRTFVAHRDGIVHAFCTLLPGRPASVAFDVMCRHPAAQPGSMEGLLVAVLQRLRDEGTEAASLGPCPLAGGAPAAFGAPLGWALRWAWGTELGDRWFGFRRLAAFKEKFRPRNEVVHLGLAPRFSALALYRMARIWALEG
ncbi:MAG: DUF2156 domain-containing protein [Myxococcota bacterium]